jgi:hypothetical protein
MTRQLSPILLILLGSFLSAASCDKNMPGRAECEGVICTMMFASVTVQVQDASGNPVIFDSTVTQTSQGTQIHKSPANANGIYTIVDDNHQKVLAMRTEEVIFKGYKDGSQVVAQAFSVSADCCHVSKVQGPAVLTIK